MEALTALLTALSSFFKMLVSYYGIWGAIGIILGVFLAIFLWRVYVNHRKDKEIKMVISEKDNTILRMKDEIRMYRVHIFKQSGWTEEEIDKHVK